MRNWEELGRCPFCARKLPLKEEVAQEQDKLLEALRESAPEVGDDACENLAPLIILDPDND